jgi:hypothetical protein
MTPTALNSGDCICVGYYKPLACLGLSRPRDSANNKGMAEARPMHQLKSKLCNFVISGRLSAKAKKAHSHSKELNPLASRNTMAIARIKMQQRIVLLQSRSRN